MKKFGQFKFDVRSRHNLTEKKKGGLISYLGQTRERERGDNGLFITLVPKVLQ